MYLVAKERSDESLQPVNIFFTPPPASQVNFNFLLSPVFHYPMRFPRPSNKPPFFRNQF